MAFGDTRARDIAITLGVAVLLACIYFFGVRGNSANTVQAADAALFLCDDNRSVTALWLPGQEGKVVLRLSHSPKAYLSGGTTADGANYASADSKVTFWNRGEEATVTENGKLTYSGCEMMNFEE